MALRLTLACISNYDRTDPILRGEVAPEGIEFVSTAIPRASLLFRRIAQFSEFDVAEMSLSTFIAMMSRDDDRYVGLPIFLRRGFRHGYVFVNAQSGIDKPEDLSGRRVGISEYQQTASLWIRAFLNDDYGVTPESFNWVTGGVDEVKLERYPIELSRNISIENAPEGRMLGEMLEKRDIDALIAPSAPKCFERRSPSVRRLFESYHKVEASYYAQTKLYPILHMVVLRRSIFEEHPWSARNIVDAFEAVRSQGWRRLQNFHSAACALPWLLPCVEETVRIFGDDPFPHGVDSNLATLEYALAQSYEQGLSPRLLDVSELFPAEVR